MNYSLQNDIATRKLGEALYQGAQHANCLDLTIFLSGELGAGKTTLVRGFIQAWGYLDHIKSPTFSLVEPYDAIHGKIYHFDLYRLRSFEELELIGIRDYFESEALRIIEWPEKAGDFLPTPDIHVMLTYANDGRQATLTGHTQQGNQVLAGICENV